MTDADNPRRQPRRRPRLRSDERTRKLVFEAARCEFESCGYTATSMEVVARRAGVSTKTLYRIVPRKAALLEDLVAEPSGYHELVIAREGVKAPRDMADPDDNRVRLVPPGQDGVTQIGIVVRARSLDAYRQFYCDILGFPEEPSSSGLSLRLGDSLLLIREDMGTTINPIREAPGWRFIMLQVA